MEVGTEISQKIRSAIKAKLMELGAYVDDELPDYIMVMVANKKNKSQMKSDLSLFLGNNTDAFTTWLHGLLGKLQTLTVDSGNKAEKANTGKEKKKKEGKPGKGDSSKKIIKDKEKKKNRKRKSSHGSVDEILKAKVPAVSKGKDGTDANIEDSNIDNNSGLKQVASEPMKEVENESNREISKSIDVPEQVVQEEFEDVRQLLVAPTPGDDLARELDAVEEEVVISKSAEKKRDSSPVPTASKEIKSKASMPAVSSKVQHQEQNIKRKLPSSVVASVSRSRDEEEYDPFNPAVGSVASVVKVTSRKTNVPASMQANSDGVTEQTAESYQNCQGEVPMDDSNESKFKPNQDDIMTADNNIGPDPHPATLHGLVALGDVKKVLAEVLKEHKQGVQLDEIGHFSHSVESSLRKLDSKAFSQAKVQIERLLAGFVGGGSLGSKDFNHSELARTGDADSEKSDRIIFSSKSKGPFLKSHGRGSEFYRSFVSTILNPSATDNNGQLCSTDTTLGQGSPVSSTRKDCDSPSVLSNSFSSLKSKSQTSVASPNPSSSKLTHLSSSSTLLRPSPKDGNSSSTLRGPQPDPGFHRLRSQILVDSLHSRRRAEAAASPNTSPCLLRHALSRQQQLQQQGTEEKDYGDIGSAEMSTECGLPHSPPHFSGEALKGLAKNLRVTIINRQAVQAQGSSSDDEDETSSEEDSDEDEDDSSEEGDKEESVVQKDKEGKEHKTGKDNKDKEPETQGHDV